jgi:hypothetical protein
MGLRYYEIIGCDANSARRAQGNMRVSSDPSCKRVESTNEDN